MRFLASEAANAVGGRLVGPDAWIDGASFDSRSLRPGQLFVPIVAERDGHDYVADALAAGASAYLTSREPLGGTAIVVPDTLWGLLHLGGWGRERVPDRVVGVTGSVGKTSVKDIAATVLAKRWRTTANERSFNNDQGLPVTILGAPEDVEALVLEMGMRGFGEIARLCHVARPTIGVVTSVAPAHSERVGGIEGVVRAKAELVEALPPSGVAILNADQSLVSGMRARTSATVLTFGPRSGDVRAADIELDRLARASFTLITPAGQAELRLALSGQHMVANACAAAAIGLALDVPLDDIAAGLESATLSPWRMEISEAPSGAVVINDTYNANPMSMKAALDTLAAVPAQRHIAVLGVMAEIHDAELEHRAIVAYAERRGIQVIAVGTPLYGVASVPSIDDLELSLTGSDAVLVKGSRVAALEQLAARLLAAE